jgi:hypothetical protein
MDDEGTIGYLDDVHPDLAKQSDDKLNEMLIKHEKTMNMLVKKSKPLIQGLNVYDDPIDSEKILYEMEVMERILFTRNQARILLHKGNVHLTFNKNKRDLYIEPYTRNQYLVVMKELQKIELSIEEQRELALKHEREGKILTIAEARELAEIHVEEREKNSRG